MDSKFYWQYDLPDFFGYIILMICYFAMGENFVWENIFFVKAVEKF